jgi:hypothetical protein
MKPGPANMNKNATSTMSSSSGVLATDGVRATIYGTTKYAKNLKDNIIFRRVRLSLREATEILLAFIVVLSLAGAVALGVVLLYYTSTR